MLTQLTIENFAIIDKLTLNLKDGMTVMTGETGSGKSVIVDALELLTGARFRKTMVKNRAYRTLVEGVFLPDQSKRDELARRGFDDEILVVTRIIDQNERSHALINGRMQTLSTIMEITRLLMDIHGQNENQSLFDRTQYLALLDRRLPQAQQHKAALEILFQKRTEAEAAEQSLAMDDAAVEREKELLSYQMSEIDALALQELDEEAINEEYDRLTNMASIKKGLQAALDALSHADASATEALSAVTRFLEPTENFDARLTALAERARNLYYEAEDLAHELDRTNESLYDDPEREDELNTLISGLTSLKRKYGKTVPDILSFREKAYARWESLTHISEEREKYRRRIAEIDQEIQKICDVLSAKRHEMAADLEERIVSELHDLNMKDAIFRIVLEKKEPAPNGQDRAAFLIRTNKASALGPLTEIASGGEMSRIMLGFKRVLADKEEIETLIFDEIDTGISGKTAQIVGEKIVDIARNRQVIVISHLPQIAALSDHHLLIEKTEGEKGVSSCVTEAVGAERVDALARLMAGRDLTEAARAQAREMIAQAEKLKIKEKNNGEQ